MVKLKIYEAIIAAEGPAGWDYTPARTVGVAVSEAAAHALARSVAEERWPPVRGCVGHKVEVRTLSPYELDVRLGGFVEEGTVSPRLAGVLRGLVRGSTFEIELSEGEAEALLDKIYSAAAAGDPGRGGRSGVSGRR